MAELNHDRIRTKLDDISSSLKRLRRLASMDSQVFINDEDSQDIARSRLLTAIEAALNICYHVSAKKLTRVPEDYAQCFSLLAGANLISPALAERLGAMARFRNRLVHLYWDIDWAHVYEIITKDLDDLNEFASEAASWI